MQPIVRAFGLCLGLFLAALSLSAQTFRGESIAAAITIGSGTGVPINDAGTARVLVYKVTVSYTNAVTNGVTLDLTIAGSCGEP